MLVVKLTSQELLIGVIINVPRSHWHKVVEQIRFELMNTLGYQYESLKVIDSMPIPVCKFGRAHFHKSFKPEASYGKCPLKKETYYGFKLHATIALDDSITNFTITSADIDDRVAICDLTNESPGTIVIGDKGYIGDRLAGALKSERHISLISLKRSNSKIKFPKALRQAIFKARRRVETSFSQLSQQLNIQGVLAKSKWGFISRITNKIVAHNLCFFINKLFNIKMNPAKIKQLPFG